MKSILSRSAFVLAGLFSAATARGEPVLQLYIEGSTYDTASETWVLESSVPTFRLWTIGNVGQFGTIYDTKLAVVYDTLGNEALKVELVGSTTGNYGGFFDPSAAVGVMDPTTTDSTGALPTLGDGSSLPNHGEYGVGRTWQEFDLGDMKLTDSPIADFSIAQPTPTAKKGQINVYEITISQAVDNVTVHFDLYDHIASGNKGKVKYKYVFAPFSHDGEVDYTPPVTPDDTPVVPIPGAAGLGGVLLVRTMTSRPVRLG